MDGQIRAVGRAVGRGLRLGLEAIESPSVAKSLARQGRRMLIIHAEPVELTQVVAGTDGFFPKLAAIALRHGIQTRVVKADSQAAEIMSARGLGNVHLSFCDQPRYAPDALHVGPGPIRGFWYLDEVGVKWNSSLRFGQFAPERIDRGAAEFFFNGVTGWMLRNNVSQLAQNPRSEPGLHAARAVIFCQEIERHPHRAHYLTTEQMIRTVAEHERSRRIFVKPHPNQTKPMQRVIHAVAQDYPNVVVSVASVHDLIAGADVVVTQNSSAGFEALMQKKPVITCAKADYWQATMTARRPEELCEALDHGPDAMADFPFEKYFYWFLHRHLLEEAKENFAERAWEKIREKAFL